MMGIITENKKTKIVRDLIDKHGLSNAIQIMGGYDKLKNYINDITINIEDKEYIINDIKHHVQHYFDNETQGVEGVELNDYEMIHLPDNSDDEYDEYITSIGEDGVLVTVYHYGNFEDDYNIWWKDLPTDLFIKVFEILFNK